VRITKGAIGYVEYSYAEEGKLATVSMINKDGNTVSPSPTAFETAAANSKWDKDDGFYVIPTDQHGLASWPIISATFVFVPKAKGPHRGRRGAEVLCLGLCQRRQDGRGHRLRAVAEEPGRRHREGLGEHNQGCERKAALFFGAVKPLSS
jgi:hypothetical protein